MKRDQTTFPRPRESWAAHRPAPASDKKPRTGPTHLVVTNDAEDREDMLLGVAGRLAGRAGSSIRVARLYDPPPLGDLENVRRLSPTDRGGPAAEACERLLRAARTLADRTGLPVASELITGPIGPALADSVRVNEFDLVTAATGGRWLSVWGCGAWYRVARQRPVVVVGPRVSRSWPALPGPTGEVLALLDGTAGAERILAPAAGLCRLLDARLTLLRAGTADGGPAGRYNRYLLDVAARVRREVPAVRTISASGSPADTALAVQRATSAVVALCAPAGSRPAAVVSGRLAVRVLRGASAPVLFHRPTS